MPRDSNGVYSLPGGNPVVTGTVISSAWANTTLEDVADALSDSLSRSGDGGMTAPLELPNGTVGTPSLSFTTDTDTGFYRGAANRMDLSIGGTLAAYWSATETVVRFPVWGPNGTAAAPAYTFESDPDTGIYRVGANELAMAAGNTSFLSLNTGRLLSSVIVNVPDGAVGGPSFSFANDADTGFYRVGGNTIGVAANGVLQWTLDTGGLSASSGGGGRIFVNDGTSANPAYSFANDTNTGIYRIGADNIGIICGTVSVARFSDDTVFIDQQIDYAVNVVNNVLGGAATAPPANPVGYFAISINGTQRRVAFYAD